MQKFCETFFRMKMQNSCQIDPFFGFLSSSKGAIFLIQGQNVYGQNIYGQNIYGQNVYGDKTSTRQKVNGTKGLLGQNVYWTKRLVGL